MAATLMTDRLPERKGSIRGASVTFDPATGVMELVTSKRAVRKYRVAELPVCRTSFRGRCFQLDKVTEGTDGEADSYAVMVADAGPGWDTCECKGHLRWHHCSHADGVRSLVANRWV